MRRSRLRSLFVGLGLGLATAISIAVAAPPTKVGDLQVNGSASITGSAYVGNTVTIAGGPKWSAGTSAPVGACVTGSMYSLTSNVSPGFYVCSASAWVSVSGGTLTGSGTSGDLASWTGTSTLGNYAGSACGAGSGVIALSPTGAVTCGILGITNSAANNVIPKSNGTNLVTSLLSDSGTHLTYNTTAMDVNASSGAVSFSGGAVIGGNETVAGTLQTTGADTDKSTLTVWGAFSGSGAINLGDSAADPIAFNGSASTTLDMNSHKILDVTNGTAAQDAAAFGQIATAISVGISGTSGRSTRFTGTNTVGNGAWTDDGTNATMFGTLLVSGVFQAASSAITLVPNTSVTSGWLDVHSSVYAASDSVYIGNISGSAPYLGFNYGSAATSTGYINPVGAGESTTQFRNLWVCDGKGSASANCFAQFDGTTHNTTLGGTLIESNGTQLGSGAVGGTLDDTAGYLALETAGHATNIGGTLRVNGNASTDQYFTAGTSLYAGGSSAPAYISSAVGGIGHAPSLNCQYLTNAPATCYLDVDGYAESTTQPRDLWLQDGQGSGSGHSIAEFAASGHASTFFGNITESGRLIQSTASGTSPMVDFKQTGQTEWQLYQTGSTNNLELWNSTVGADVDSWDLNGNLTHTKGASFTGTGSTYSFSNTPIGGAGTPEGKHVEIYDEMLGEVPTSVTGGGSASIGDWTMYTSGTGAAVGQAYDATNGAGRPGQRSLAYSASTTANGYAAMVGGLSYYLPDGTTTFDAALEWPTLSSTGSGIASLFLSQIGFTTGWSGVAPVNGCYFAYDAGNQLTGGVNGGFVQALECWCAKSSVRTGYLINNTGNSDESFPLGVGTVAAATFYRLAIVITGTTRAEFYRNGVKVCDINTNLPSSTTIQVQPAFSVLTKQATGTGARGMTIDWARVRVDLNSVRSP